MISTAAPIMFTARNHECLDKGRKDESHEDEDGGIEADFFPDAIAVNQGRPTIP